MNDFTKEELRLIINTFDNFECDLKTWDIYTPIYMKIQSMFDNYCEHKCFIEGCNGKLFPVCCVTEYKSE